MRIATTSIDPDALRKTLANPAAGAYVAFEGWIRNENEGQEVLRLEYEVYEPVAVKEGQRVIAEATERYPVLEAACVHRAGLLEIGD